MSSQQDDPDLTPGDSGAPRDEAARRQAEALRKDREKAARAAAKEAARAERDRERAARDAEKAQRDREKAARAAEKELERLRADQERAVREIEREADRAEREAQKAALDATLAAQRAARQVERARLRALAAEQVEGAQPETDGPELPPGLALLWRPTPTGRRGPRPGLTVRGIADAAIALADADGLGAVSMARVAERLGVTTMALYRYVPSKGDLVALMIDTALAEAVAAAPEQHPDPEPGDDRPAWRIALERWCQDQLALARQHPWSVQTPVAAALPGPARVAFLERGLRALDGTPLSWAEKTAVVGRLSLHLLSEGQVVAAEALAGRNGGAEHPALLDYTALLTAVADPEQHPVLSEALAARAFDGDEPGDGDWGLGLMLDGVAALIERARARG